MEKIEGKEKLLGAGSVHATYPNPNACTSKHIPNHTQAQSPCHINRHGSIPDTSRQPDYYWIFVCVAVWGTIIYLTPRLDHWN
jgi:hypothetical protein